MLNFLLLMLFMDLGFNDDCVLDSNQFYCRVFSNNKLNIEYFTKYEILVIFIALKFSMTIIVTQIKPLYKFCNDFVSK